MRTQQISPSVNGYAVTPNNDVDVSPHSLKGWSVNADGYVNILLEEMPSGAAPLLVYAKAGVRYPDIVRRFLVNGISNTTATGINAYY